MTTDKDNDWILSDRTVNLVTMVGVVVACCALIVQCEQFRRDADVARNSMVTNAWVLWNNGRTSSTNTGQGEAATILLQAGLSLEGQDAQGSDLSGLQVVKTRDPTPVFSHANFCRAKFNGSGLVGADLSGSVFGDDVQFAGVQAAGARFRWAYLTGARFVGGDFRRTDFSYADLRNAVAVGTDFSSADFSYADLRDASLSPLSDARTGTTMRGAVFVGTDLRGADLIGVTGLTSHAIAHACVDDSTHLPAGVKRPEPACTARPRRDDLAALIPEPWIELYQRRLDACGYQPDGEPPPALAPAERRHP